MHANSEGRRFNKQGPYRPDAGTIEAYTVEFLASAGPGLSRTRLHGHEAEINEPFSEVHILLLRNWAWHGQRSRYWYDLCSVKKEQPSNHAIQDQETA